MFGKYEYVYAVYKEKSFTKAAQKLFISQPSLSAAIKNLENKIGAPLFERTSSQITLTEIGKAYIETAEKIMSAEDDFANKIHDIYNLKTGHISIGSTNYMFSYVLPELIKTFSSLYPEIEINLESANSITLKKMMLNEQIDILIDSFDELDPMYDGHPLFKERILICVPAEREINNSLKAFQIEPENIYAGGFDFDLVPSVPIKAFKDEGFILLDRGNDMYERASAIFNKAGLSPKVLFSVDQINTSYLLVNSGLGLCFATDTFFKYGKFRQKVILYNVEKELCSRTLYIANKKGKYRSKAMEAFINVAGQMLTSVPVM